MNDQEKGIKLAKAMGYAFVPITDSWLTPCGKRTVKNLPDPYQDANDDYAVLEWMRDKYAGNEDAVSWDSEWFVFKDALQFESHEYQIGDYARAALKEIENAS